MTAEPIEPMEGLSRVETENGSHIEPAYNDRWSEVVRISWLLAVIEIDYGLRAKVYDSNYRIGAHRVKPPHYGVALPGISMDGGTFPELWRMLNNLGTGYRIGRQTS